MRHHKLTAGALGAVGVLALAAVPFLGSLDAGAESPHATPRAVRRERLVARRTAAELRLHPLASAEKAAELRQWYSAAVWNDAIARSTQQASTGRRSGGRGGGSGGGGTCAGSIPGNVIYRESKCDPNARNSRSGASGKYQVLDSTWSGYGGYASAAEAPEGVQDQWAAEAYAQAGCGPWGGC
jgi:Transglycosylase-like domain